MCSFRFPSTIFGCSSGNGIFLPGGAEEPNSSAKLPLPCHKWRLLISYDGTKFSGWQYQRWPPTIQCAIEKALMVATKLERHELCLVGASRTDTGVHAWGQVAQFVTPFSYDNLENLHAAVNGLLPSEIRVREISAARPEFHARFSSESKVYCYKIYNNPVMDPFQSLYAYHVPHRLNVTVMREAAKNFVGKHDFTSFSNHSRGDRVGALLQLEVEGSGFLYRQVRNMVALLLQIGREALPADIVPAILACRDRKALAKVTLITPPHGLCLMFIKYNKELLQPPLGAPPTSFGRLRQVSKWTLIPPLTQLMALLNTPLTTSQTAANGRVPYFSNLCTALSLSLSSPSTLVGVLLLIYCRWRRCHAQIEISRRNKICSLTLL
ncbi:uncharacterized protein LOC18430115 isoform X2 [Amborella trichopoda]|uniref:uncharacterized protein LOC18430115 isoform X2 n=1 Tax=Amborella trichopoda TaxID=13333 RepID=UPI0009BDCE0C|nr:uncharacterized protein LOC18430115 isoform X2 [Amborella trichopoda]|eukprot:XP_020520544.1 uncharacterized protein LOC18430115 isoform X2 [Amborella trichopoda]